MEPCDICGVVGFEEAIATCSKCKIAREHVYCMRYNLLKVPEVWVCEECVPGNDKVSGVSVVHHDVVRLRESDKVSHDSRRNTDFERKRPVVPGKVKFLPTEEVIRLSSGDLRNRSPLKRDVRRAGPSITKRPPAWMKQKSRNIPSGPTREPALRRLDLSTMNNLQAQGVAREQNSPILLEKEHHIGSFKPTKEIKARKAIIPLKGVSNSVIVTEAKNKKPEVSERKQKAPIGSVSKQQIASVKPTEETETCKVNVPGKEEQKAPISSVSEQQIVSVEPTEGTEACKANVPGKEKQKAPIGSFSEQQIVSVKPTEGTEACKANVPGKEKQKAPIGSVSEQQIASVKPTEETETCKANVPGKEASNSCPIAEAEHKNAGVEEGVPSNILHKLRLYQRHCPALLVTWKGGFKFLDTTTPGTFYGGFQAQPSCHVNHQAYKFSEKMPIVLNVQFASCCDVRRDLFQNQCPDFNDIGLYFFPSANIERSRATNARLINLMDSQNSLMRSCIDDVELLIFTSKQLQVDSQEAIARSTKEPFLWGVFCYSKDDHVRCKINNRPPSLVSPLESDRYNHGKMESNEVIGMEINMAGGNPSLVSLPKSDCFDHAQTNSGEDVDMEIDMLGGIAVGTVDVAVLQGPSRRACGQSAKQSVDEEPFKKLKKASNAFWDRNSPNEKLLSISQRAQGDIRQPCSEVARKNGGDLSNISPLQNSLEKLSDAAVDESNIPPGFDGLFGQEGQNIACKTTVQEEKPHLVDLRLKSPIKEGVCPKGLTEVRDGLGGEMIKVGAEKSGYDKLGLIPKLSPKQQSEVEAPLGWSSPSTGWVKLNVVGRATGNPGAAAASGIMSDENGRWIQGYILNLGIQEGLAAELWAVFQGLMLAGKWGYKKVVVESNCPATVECLKKEPSPNDPNISLIDCCINLIKSLWDCEVKCIRREENWCANWLAASFSEYPLGTTLINSPPLKLLPFLAE